MLDPDFYETVLVIGDIIAAHCPNTVARSEFIRACLSADWHEAASMIDGMLVEPWRLKGRQETRLREFLNQLIELLSDPDVLKKSPLNRPLEAGAWVPDLPRTGDIQSDTLAASAGRPTARIPGRPGCSPRLGDPSFETPGENGGAWARLR
jgi:hypothetical protein